MTTSRLAHDSIRPHAASLRESIARVIADSAAHGMTCDEIEVHIGLRHQTASARIKELADAGRIRRTQRTRKTRSGRTAAVYVSGRANDRGCSPHNDARRWEYKDGNVYCTECGRYVSRDIRERLK